MPRKSLGVLAVLLLVLPDSRLGAQEQAGAAPVPVVVGGLTAGDELNVRATASPVGLVLGRLPNGSLARKYQCETVRGYEWCRIVAVEIEGLAGWTPARYLREARGEAAATIASLIGTDAEAGAEDTPAAAATPPEPATPEPADTPDAARDSPARFVEELMPEAPAAAPPETLLLARPAIAHAGGLLEFAARKERAGLDAAQTAFSLALAAPEPRPRIFSPPAPGDPAASADEPAPGVPVPTPRPRPEAETARAQPDLAGPEATERLRKNPRLPSGPELRADAGVKPDRHPAQARTALATILDPQPQLDPLTVAQTRSPDAETFDLTAEIPCARYLGQPMTRCAAGIRRTGEAAAEVTVTWPDGGDRVIRFQAGKPAGANTRAAFRYTREANLNLIRVGLSERFEISDALLLRD